METWKRLPAQQRRKSKRKKKYTGWKSLVRKKRSTTIRTERTFSWGQKASPAGKKRLAALSGRGKTFIHRRRKHADPRKGKGGKANSHKKRRKRLERGWKKTEERGNSMPWLQRARSGHALWNR